ncbi:MAG: hypothetical protein QG556_836 [Pseudomonadota bacterium]|nr:hypothetical protein [Pseudomonadota bacterium]
MKLVTGIEAIQSGKPWKRQEEDRWRHDDMLVTFTSVALRRKDFIIKEEPREFWIKIEDTFQDRGSIQSKEWIRVREVEE